MTKERPPDPSLASFSAAPDRVVHRQAEDTSQPHTETTAEPAAELAEPKATTAGTPALAEQVRELREALGVTQAELAERIGTRQQTVSEWETGAREPRRMSRRLLRMVAEESGHYDARAAAAFADPPRASRRGRAHDDVVQAEESEA